MGPRDLMSPRLPEKCRELDEAIQPQSHPRTSLGVCLFDSLMWSHFQHLLFVGRGRDERRLAEKVRPDTSTRGEPRLQVL